MKQPQGKLSAEIKCSLLLDYNSDSYLDCTLFSTNRLLRRSYLPIVMNGEFASLKVI
jgi:hypothetical protein